MRAPAKLRLPRKLQPQEEAELVDHLDELRKRLLVFVSALLAGCALGYALHADIIRALTQALPEGKQQLVTLSVAEPFMTSIKVSLFVGFVLSMPVLLWQTWGFFAPTMQRGTQRVVVTFVMFSALLLAGGLAFGYLVALPSAVHFLTNFDADLYNIQLRAASYYSFTLTVLLACGLVFQLPVFILGLVRVGAISSQKLRQSRRIGYAAVATLAVVLPGVDPVTTALEMIPLAALLELSIWLSVLMDRRRFGKRPAPAAAAA